MAKAKYEVVALIAAQPPLRKYAGREAWCLGELIKAGPAGITAAQYPGARISHYVRELRKSGLEIETQDEKHGGTFAGTHGRYILKTPTRIFPCEYDAGRGEAA